MESNDYTNKKRRPDNDLNQQNRTQQFNYKKSREDGPYVNNNSYQNSNFNSGNSNSCQMSRKKELPIEKYKNDILNKIENNQVIIIAGETGCGKTTQVPQFIYEGCVSKNENVNILITQPRRIAAISISKRLSEEMNSRTGDLVGYHVGMNPVFKPNITKILIVTTGIFLQRLIHERNLDEFTHIILDEVHERDIDIDFCLILVKYLLKANKRIKLILMSATIATVLFANYFSTTSIHSIDQKNFYGDMTSEQIENSEIEKRRNDKNINLQTFPGQNLLPPTWGNSVTYSVDNPLNNSFENTINNKNKNNELVKELDSAPIIEIEEKFFKVDIFYLDSKVEGQNMIDRIGRELNVEMFNLKSHLKANFDKKYPKIDSYQYEICFYIIKNIHKGNIFKNEPNDTPFHVLVFLPGFNEIAIMHEILNTRFDDYERSQMEIHRLHSNLNE